MPCERWRGMTEAELIWAVADDTGYPMVTVRTILRAAGYQVSSTLRCGGSAVLPELGKLKVTPAPAAGGRPRFRFLPKRVLREGML